MTEQAGKTEAQTIAEIALDGAAPEPLSEDIVYSVIVPYGAQQKTIDLEHLRPAPRRTRGHVTVLDGESFAAYFDKHASDGPSVIYADIDTSTVTAVLNDAAGADAPGWRDHVLTLRPKVTPEWVRWRSISGRLLSQEQFAEHIEDSLPDIVTPAASTMLELAQTFEAKTRVNFESQQLLESGQRQLVYQEETTATAGRGTIEVPREIELGVAVYEIGELYSVKALLRYKVGNGNLQIGIKLQRVEDVLRDAFGDIVKDVQDRTSQHVIYGTPAGSTVPQSV